MATDSIDRVADIPLILAGEPKYQYPGIPTTCDGAEAIAWVEEQFGLSYSDSGMRKLLKRLDYRYKQPAVLPAKADVEAQAAWVETYTAKRGH